MCEEAEGLKGCFRRTFVLQIALYAWFAGPAKAVPTCEFKVLGHVVHFLSF